MKVFDLFICFYKFFRAEAILDKDGNIEGLLNHGLNVGDEELLFKSIAQFVKNGSFIEYEREGYNGKVKERFDFLNGNIKRTTCFEERDMKDSYYWNEIEP